MSQTAENAPIVGGKVAAYGGAGTAVVSGLKLHEIGVIIGIVVGVLGLLLSQYWSWRKDRREQREQRARMRRDFGTDWDHAG